MDGVLLQMTVGTNTLRFTYAVDGTPCSVNYNGTEYYYVTNQQGDVTAILDGSGNAVTLYTYDAWGKLLSSSGSQNYAVGLHNPLRYRGYVYDTETGLYYLQSRYYDPEVGRFINADALASTGQGVLGHNMYAYCLNNPLFYSDYSGKLPRKNSVNINDGNPIVNYICYLRQVAEFEKKCKQRREWWSGAMDKLVQTTEAAWSSLEASAGVGLGYQIGVTVLDVGIVVGMYGSNATLKLDNGSIQFGREFNNTFSAEVAYLGIGIQDSEFIVNGKTVSRDKKPLVFLNDSITIFDFSLYAGPGCNLGVSFNVVEFLEELMEIY